MSNSDNNTSEVKRENELSKDLTARLNVMQSEQQERMAKQRAEVLGMLYINLITYPINSDVIGRMSKEASADAKAVLFYKQGRDVRVGAVNPELSKTKEYIANVQTHFNTEPMVYVISHRSLDSSLNRYVEKKQVSYSEAGKVEVAEEELEEFSSDIKNLEELGQHIVSLPPTEVLENVVSGAVKMGASDIHIEPGSKDARLRYRMDGVLQDIISFQKEGWKILLSRIKVLSGLKLNVHAIPQDGSFVLHIGKKIFDVRVSVLPGGNGENIVMRVLSRDTRTVKVTELGMKQRDYDVVMNSLKKSNGMILITGPTGSGKTTSLASFLQEINEEGIKIITLENPIEYRLEGVEQTQVDAQAGYTFAKGLRAILRQDPDVIMVGEIRDVETAETALHASLTGHLVFSTLHTNDAPGAVPRLVDLGVQPFIIAPAINLIIAQRLVRKVCSKCGVKYKPTQDQLDHIADSMAGLSMDIFDPAALENKELEFMKVVGCEECGKTGYKGRIGVFEVMIIEGEVEELVLQGSDGNALRQAAQKAGMSTILQDGYLKVIEGITTIEEVERISED